MREATHSEHNIPIKSVWSLIQETSSRCPDRVALGIKREGVWVKWTYRQYLQDINLVAKAFIKLGLKQHHAVCILGFNSPEWFISNIAAVVAGGLATGIYTTNSPKTVQYVAKHSRANIIVVADEEQLEKVRQVRGQLEDLVAIMQ